jgi:Na+/phosphate symporter
MHKERPILRALNRLREHSNRTIEELLFRITLLSRENIRLLAEVQHYNQNKQPPIPPAIDYIGRPLEQLVNKLIEGQLAISQSQQSDIEQALAASLEQFELLCAELKSQQEEFRRLEVKHRQTLEECERLRRPDRIQQQTNADSLSIAQSTTDERVRAVEDERKQLAHALHQKRRFSTSDNGK